MRKIYRTLILLMIACAATIDTSVMDCDIPHDAFPGGSVTVDKTTANSTATYRCYEGYNMTGSDTSVCQANGTWSNVAPSCTIVDCGTPHDADPSSSVTFDKTTVNSTATYRCYEGYNMTGSDTSVCQANGTWSNVAPSCTIVDCGTPHDADPSSSVTVDKTTANSTATYRCYEGYNMTGSDTSVCQANGTWSNVAPSCTIVDCGTPHDADPGGSVTVDKTTANSTATYRCYEGYNMTGSDTSVCQANGTWSNVAPSCTIVDCGTPHDADPGGSVTVDKTTANSTATYRCYEGYNMTGSDTSVCQANGTWSNVAPSCTIVDCGTPHDADPGGSVTVDKTTANSTATYRCYEGYNMTGSDTSVCQANGTWSNVAPSCTIVDCGTPHDADPGGSVTVDKTTANSTATYRCYEGYNMTGSDTSVCQANGTWSNVAPSCTIVDCGTPHDADPGGSVTVDKTTANSTATYRCYEGYNMTGSDTSVCQANGTWSNVAPSCTIVDCGTPHDADPGGSVTVDKTTANSTATYRCYEGYNMTGSDTSVCQANGTWSNVAPSCTIVVHNYSENCTHGGPQGQCRTNNSHCLEYNDAGFFTCQCDKWNYYDEKYDACLLLHNYSENCTHGGPQGQCRTNNSHCLEYNDAGFFTCQCDKWNYYDEKYDACLLRPILQDMELDVQKSSTTTNTLVMIWKPKIDTKDTLSVIVIQPPYKNGTTTFKQPLTNGYNLKTANMLSSGTNFIIRLYIEQDGELSGNFSETSAYTKPEPPINMALTNIWERNLTVTWQNNTYGKCDNYTLTIAPTPEYGNGTVVIPCSIYNTSYIFNNLEGGTNYTVTMSSHAHEYTSENKHKHNYTRPKQVSRAYILEQYEHSLTLYMESNTTNDIYCLNVSPPVPGSEPETCVFAYNDTYYLTELEAGTSYTIKIYTYLQGRKSETYVQLENVTRPEAPKTLQLSNIKETSFDMTWSIDETQLLDAFVVSIDPLTNDFPMHISRNNNTEYNLTVKQLKKGTNYTVHICTTINTTQSENCLLDKTFTRPLPPSSVKIRTQLQTSIIVQFPADGDRKFDKYLVKFEDESGQQHTRLIDRSAAETHDPTIGIICGLTANTSYTFVVFTIIGDSQLQSLGNVSVAALTNESPLPDGIIPLDHIHEHNLTVIWQSVEDVDMYKPVLESANNSHMFNKTLDDGKDFNNYTFVGLTPGTLYDGAIVLVWTGLDSNISITLPSIYTRPTPPSIVTYTVEETSITITDIDRTWHQYVLTFDPPLNNDENRTNILWNVTSLEEPITTLSVGTFYTITIYSVVGTIQAENSYVIHMNTKPGSVRNILPVIPELNSTTMKIHWVKPEGHVSFYNVEFTCTSPNGNGSINTHTYNTTDNAATMSGLDPGTFCSVTVRATLGDQNGKTINQNISISTNETAPAKVDNFESINKTSKSIQLRWTKPQIRNGIIRNYFVTVSGSNGTCQQIIIFNCTNCLADQVMDSSTPLRPECNSGYNFQETFSEDDDVFQHNVTGLHPYRNYTMRIIAQTVAQGEDRIETVQTLEDIPGIPVGNRITNYTYNTVDLSWKPPVERNGVITAYTITYKFYEKLCQNGITDEEEEKTVTKDAVIDMIPTTEMTINESIFSYWNYTFSITANTSVGEGSPFTFAPIRTQESEPSQIETVNTSTTAYAVNINWSTPCFPNGILTKYKICLTNVSMAADQTVMCNDTNSDLTETTRSVLPYRNYTVKVAAETSAGQGQFSNEKHIEIPIAAPAKPQELRASSTATDLTVSWVKPKLELFTGPTNYSVIAVDLFNDSLYTCETNTATWIDSLATNCIVRNLHPYTNYTINVTAITGPFMNSSSLNLVQTDESTPGGVTGLTIKAESNVTKPRTISVSWIEPAYRDRHGIITNYFVQYTYVDKLTVTGKTDNKATKFLITNLQPGTYSIKVFAATRIGNGTDVSNSTTVDPGAPIKIVESSGTLLIQPASTSVSDDQKQIAIKLPLTQFLCNRSNGEPTKWGVIVSQENEATDPPFVGSLSDFQSKIKPQYKTWFDVKDSDSIKPYIATGENWKPNCPGQNRGRRRRSADATSTEDYEIGSDGDCSGIPRDKYCNGELQPGRKYRVKTFACTLGGCTETEYSEPIETKPNLTPIIAGLVSGLIVVLAVGGVLFFMRRRQAGCFAKGDDDFETTHRSGHSMDTEMKDTRTTSKQPHGFVPRQIKLADFPPFVETLKNDSGLLFADAYKMLKENSPAHPTTAAEQQTCRPKNRYTNILAFDHSRVKLLPMDDEEGSDYINANYIPGYTSPREYIATQGPIIATLDDFWRMVWEQNVDTIVMLTKLVEKGRAKCDKYWPELNEPLYYGDLVVSIQSESNLSDYTIRIIEVKLKETRRLVRHFAYLKWPDMGCPDSPSLLLDFVKAVRQHSNDVRDRTGPMVVHCSAGVGRTGTFIAVDHLLQHIRDHDEVDIYNLVLSMRNQRCNMVQTEDQYVYIHDCLRDFITMDDEEDEDDIDDPVYENTNVNTENVYENTAFTRD